MFSKKYKRVKFSIIIYLLMTVIIVGQDYNKYDKIIINIARQYELDPILVKSIIAVESNFNKNARGQLGEIGLMQILPLTARNFGISNAEKLFNPNINIDIGCHYLADCKAQLQFRCSNFEKKRIKLMLSMYNGGVMRVLRSCEVIKQTKTYVKKVYNEYLNIKKKDLNFIKAIQLQQIGPLKMYPVISIQGVKFFEIENNTLNMEFYVKVLKKECKNVVLHVFIKKFDIQYKQKNNKFYIPFDFYLGNIPKDRMKVISLKLQLKRKSLHYYYYITYEYEGEKYSYPYYENNIMYNYYVFSGYFEK